MKILDNLNIHRHYIILLLAVILLAGSGSVTAIISLQLPGLTYATGNPTTVDIEFLDSSSNPLYTLKGEVFVQSMPLQSDNMYAPDKLTGTPKYVSKIKINAGESGMVLKAFDSPTATVPKLMILLKAGFLSSAATQQPIEIDFMTGDDHQTLNQAEINWYNRDMAEFARMNGMHIGKIELHVERMESAPLVPVKSFGIVSLQSNEIMMPQAMNAVITGSSLIPAQNAVYMPAGSGNPSQVYVQQVQAAPPANSRFPNAP